MEQTALKQQPENQVVDSLFADLGEVTLLLPMASVAEVVLNVDITDAAEGAEWLHGWFDWRDIKLPLIAFEQLISGNKMVPEKDAKVLVLNTLGKGKGTDFYAILLQELPQPARVSAFDEIKILRNAGENAYVSMKVEFEDRQAVIPDLEALERFVRASVVG